MRSRTQRGEIPLNRVEIWHDGLKKHRQIRGSELEVVERKAQLQAEDWQSKWEGVKAKEVAQKIQADKKQYQEDQKALANKRTIEARFWLTCPSSIVLRIVLIREVVLSFSVDSVRNALTGYIIRALGAITRLSISRSLALDRRLAGRLARLSHT